MRKFVLLPLMTAVLTSMFVAGCASTRQVVAIPYGPVAAHNARVIVSRPQKIISCGARFTVSDNGTQIGELGPGGQLMWDRLAGPMELTAVNLLAPPPNYCRATPLHLGIGEGQTYQIQIVFPFSGCAPTIQLVSGTPTPYEQHEDTTSAGKKEEIGQGGAAFSTSPSAAVQTVKGGGGTFKAVEVKHFSQVDGLNLSPTFVDSFADGIREGLTKLRIVDQVFDEGEVVAGADAANCVIVEGKFIEYRAGGFFSGIGMISSEISLFRKSDHALITTITPRVPFKPSPLNTDTGVGKSTGKKTAYEIKKALQ